MTAKTIALVGGGTAGHVFPVLEVARALRVLEPTVRVAYIGQNGGPERNLIEHVQAVHGTKETSPLPELPFVGITAEKLRRYWHWRIFILPFAVLAGVFQALTALRHLKPQAVFCKGGYVCVPVAVAAWLLRIPIVLHETDSVMGLANRLVAPFAKLIAVSFPRPNLPSGKRPQKLVYTGQPIRPGFFAAAAAGKTKERGRPTILVIGGSQGARRMNDLIFEILPQLLERYRIVHLTGERDVGRARGASSDPSYEPIAFTNELDRLMLSADVVVSRAGGTVFEIAAMGKPAILIPLPSAANDHQRMNATMLADKDAAVVLEERSLTGAQLLEHIVSLVRDSKRRALLGKNASSFARKDAATQIARLLLEIARPA